MFKVYKVVVPNAKLEDLKGFGALMVLGWADLNPKPLNPKP